jgi:hypothetical protein
MVGAVTSGSTPAPAMFFGQSDGPKEMVVFFHRWCVAGFTERTSRQRVLTSRREMSSELPPYMTYSFLRRSSPPDSESDWWKRPLRSLLGVWYPNSLSATAASASETFSLPDRRGGEVPSLEAWSRLLLRCSASFWISRHSVALWWAQGEQGTTRGRCAVAVGACRGGSGPWSLLLQQPGPRPVPCRSHGSSCSFSCRYQGQRHWAHSSERDLPGLRSATHGPPLPWRICPPKRIRW